MKAPCVCFKTVVGLH
jgi:hypothetical protein